MIVAAALVGMVVMGMLGLYQLRQSMLDALARNLNQTASKFKL